MEKDGRLHLSDDFIIRGYGLWKKFYDYSWKLIYDLTGYQRVLGPSEGMIGARDRWNGEKWTQFIDQVTWEKVFSLDNNFNHIGQFKDGLAKVRYGKRTPYGPKGKFGYINKEGKIVIPCEYDSWSQNEKGYMIATREDKLFILHFDGSYYTEKEVKNTGHASDFAWYFDDGSNRDRPWFINGNCTIQTYHPHYRLTLDTEGNFTASNERKITLESWLQLLEKFNNKERESFYECTILGKDWKEIVSTKKFTWIDYANKLILLDDGIMTFDGEYIWPLKGHTLASFIKKENSI